MEKTAALIKYWKFANANTTVFSWHTAQPRRQQQGREASVSAGDGDGQRLNKGNVGAMRERERERGREREGDAFEYKLFFVPLERGVGAGCLKTQDAGELPQRHQHHLRHDGEDECRAEERGGRAAGGQSHGGPAAAHRNGERQHHQQVDEEKLIVGEGHRQRVQIHFVVFFFGASEEGKEGGHG